MVKLNRKKLMVGGLVGLAAVVCLGLYLKFRSSGNRSADYYKSQGLKQQLFEGKCSGESFAKLRQADKGAAAKDLAATNEALGRCYSFDNDLKSAQKSYEEAAKYYASAGLGTESERLNAMADNLAPLLDETEVPPTKEEQDKLEREAGILGT
jgi:hypothetical protein